ncbi:MAG: S10 family peptidase [Anaerolineaceae bacterium]
MENSTLEKNHEEIKPNISETTSQTHHTIYVDGVPLNYMATAGTIILKDEDLEEGEKQKAAIFYIAYVLENPDISSPRPVTFSFNGGPGSSSVWMHLGMLGPRRVLMDEEGMPLPPPYKLLENEFTLLTHSDLVFIDPVSTGYSRAVPKEKPDQFHGVKKDIHSVAEFIRLWVTRNKRWDSPKFLIGESYGTTRAAGLSDYLQSRFCMYLNGVILVSSILNFITADFSPGNDLPYLLFLPTYTATAWYHRKLKPEFQKDLRATLQKVKDFSEKEYCLALMQGNRLSDKDYKIIAQKLADFTGLSLDYIQQTGLRINIHRFVKELLRKEGLTVGRIDSRYTGFDRDSAGEFHENDPSMTAVLGPYAAMLNDYVRRDLNYEVDKLYEILSNLYETWKYDDYQNHYVNTAENLRIAFQANPNLKVIVLNGYYDLATPFYATEYTFDHLELPKKVLSNIAMKYYEAGHMIYVHLPSLKLIARDLRDFIEASK